MSSTRIVINCYLNVIYLIVFDIDFIIYLIDSLTNVETYITTEMLKADSRPRFLYVLHVSSLRLVLRLERIY